MEVPVTISTSDQDLGSALCACGRHLPDDFRERILALGATVVPTLIAILEDEELALADSPGEGWPPIHAVDLLADLKAAGAAEVLVRILARTDWDETLHDRIVVRLHELGVAVLEPALAELAREASSDLRASLCAVLAKIGIQDARIFDEIRAVFAEDETSGAMCFADYGDPRALPFLEQAIRDFQPDEQGRFGIIGLADLADAHERLGGVLPEELKAKVTRLGEEWSKKFKDRFIRDSPATSAKIGRNEPCPCGSGKKYKKCCLGA